jgi:hypothetical protein
MGMKDWSEKKIKKMTFWDMALIKYTAMFFGLIIGAYISGFVRQYIWLFLILFIAGYITAVYRFFMKK